jgi:competence protein ComEC
LHVGILFWMLNLLFFFFDKFKHGKLIRTILLLLLLWAYALLTGMATPVMRATVMFSFLLVGKHFSRYTNTINTLAASAFLMLLINPFALADTGFQLSYLSVLGILVIYPLLTSLLEPRNRIIEKGWELACLSASAQLAIAPLSILYFHQFPNYFIFTNLIIVPLLSIVIYSGILFLLTAHIPYISYLTTWLFQKSLWLMNGIVGHSSKLPFYVTKGISISPLETILLFICIISLFVFSSYKRYRTLFFSLSCLLLFMGIRVYKNIIHSRQQIMAVYHISKHPAIAFISGKQCLMAYSDIDSSDFKYHIQFHFWERGINDTVSLLKDTSGIFLSGHLMFEHNIAQFNDKRYAFIRSNQDMPDASQKFNVHCIIVSKDYKLGMIALQNAFTFDAIIFDSSISPARLKKWKNECEQLHISYYDVASKGAYIENS